MIGREILKGGQGCGCPPRVVLDLISSRCVEQLRNVEYRARGFHDPRLGGKERGRRLPTGKCRFGKLVELPPYRLASLAADLGKRGQGAR